MLNLSCLANSNAGNESVFSCIKLIEEPIRNKLKP